MIEKNKAIEWIEERMSYISENCDLKESDNKLAFDSLKYAKKCIEELEKKDKIIDKIVLHFQQICVSPSLAKYQWKRICKEDNCEGYLCEDCIKQYFEKKVEKEIENEYRTINEI